MTVVGYSAFFVVLVVFICFILGLFLIIYFQSKQLEREREKYRNVIQIDKLDIKDSLVGSFANDGNVTYGSGTQEKDQILQAIFAENTQLRHENERLKGKLARHTHKTMLDIKGQSLNTLPKFSCKKLFSQFTQYLFDFF